MARQAPQQTGPDAVRAGPPVARHTRRLARLAALRPVRLEVARRDLRRVALSGIAVFWPSSDVPYFAVLQLVYFRR